MPTVSLKEFDALLVTRTQGRDIASRLPNRDAVVLDLKGVAAASPSFLDELIKDARSRGIAVTFKNVSSRTGRMLDQIGRVREVS